MTKKKTQKKHTPWIARQGDVVIIRENSLTGTEEITPANGRHILAIGESSGHCHVVDSDKAKLFRLAEKDESAERAVDRMLQVMVPTTIRVESTTSRAHLAERHTPIELAPGTYRIRIQSEYSPEAIRNVED